MTPVLRTLAGILVSCSIFSSGARAQSEEGIPVRDPLVIAKCASCHARDDRGNMQRISYARTTPEGWQDVLKQLTHVNGVSVPPTEARALVRYLSANHGLAPDEAKPILYDPERRMHEESKIPTD